MSNSNFQSESKHSGDEFESRVYSDLLIRGHCAAGISKNVHMLGTGCELDFVSCGEYIEAKGGKNGPKKRPGAKRTDNDKKAIANASLIKTKYDIYYVVYFSSPPKSGSYSDEMLTTALEAGILDEVRYLEY